LIFLNRKRGGGTGNEDFSKALEELFQI